MVEGKVRLSMNEELKNFFEPTNHKYGTHPSYTGPGCVFCGKEEAAHGSLAQEEERGSFKPGDQVSSTWRPTSS